MTGVAYVTSTDTVFILLRCNYMVVRCVLGQLRCVSEGHGEG